MQIHFGKGKGIALFFPKDELRQALQVLKAIYLACPMTFIAEAIEDIEVELRPRLTLVSHNHLCEVCFRMVDDLGENAIHLIGETDKWKHRECKPLKDNRPD